MFFGYFDEDVEEFTPLGKEIMEDGRLALILDHSHDLLDLFREEKFQKQVRKDMRYIDRFCKEYETQLVKIDLTMESGNFEPAYFFNSSLEGMGYFTSKGIRDSLN